MTESSLRDADEPATAVRSSSGSIRPGLLLIPVIALAVVLVSPFPVHGRHWAAIFDLAHAPSFFAVYLGSAAMLDPRSIGWNSASSASWPLNFSRLALLAASLWGIGLICELAQQLVARQPSLVDVAANGLGLLAGFFWCAGRKMRRLRDRFLLTAIVPTLIGIPGINAALELQECRRQHQEFPLLASFERDRESGAWMPHEADVRITTAWSSHGGKSLQITAKPGTRFPGASLIWPVADWTGFSEFAFQIHNPQAKDLMLGISISDGLHPASGFDPLDRFRRTVRIQAETTVTVRIALSDIASAPANRETHLDRISMVDLYMPGMPAGAVLLLDNLHLVR